jgi:urease accessory protein
MVGADLGVMDRDTKRMRGERPFLFTNLKTGDGVTDIIHLISKLGNLALE